jgi:carbon monoxide dehydrogenase subunit G
MRGLRKYLAWILPGFALFILVPAMVQAQAWLSEDDRLARGEVIISFKEAPGTSLHDVEGVILIDAPPELIWEALTDYASYHRIFPSISGSEVLEHKEDTSRVRIRINNLWPYPDFEYVLVIKEDKSAWSVSWNMEEGNLKTTYGSCSFQLFPPDAEKTKVVYVLSRDTGEWFVPGFSKDLDNRNILIERLLALRKEIREKKKALEEKKNDSEIKPKWRKALFWWEKDEQGQDREKPKEKPGKDKPKKDAGEKSPD